MSIIIDEFPHFKHLLEYGVFNEYCELIGIKDEAPPEIKKSYEEFEKMYEEAAKKGIKL